VRVDNSAESGATAGAGTNVTVGNSGGASGTAWSSVSIGSGVTLRYDNAQSAHGGWSIRHAVGATSAQGLLFWDSTALGSRPRLWLRLYVRFSSVATARDLVRVRAAGTQVLRVRMGAGGQLELRNSANGISTTSGGTTLAANTWYRIETDVRPGATQTNTVRVFVGDSTSLFTSMSATDNYSSATTVDEITWGNAAAASNLPDSWLDDLAAGDVDWLGPAAVSAAGNIAGEVDQAAAGGGIKESEPVGAGETSTSVGGFGGKTGSGSLAAAVESAVAGAGVKSRTAGVVGDLSTVPAGGGTKTGVALPVVESSAVVVGGGVKTCTAVVAVETATAAAGAGGKTGIGAAGETSTAAGGVGGKFRPGAPAAELDTAGAGAGVKTVGAGVGSEADGVPGGVGEWAYLGEPALEVDTAWATTVVPPARPVDTRRVRAGTTTSSVRATSTTKAARAGSTTAGVRIR
jgi:hypothetical protein